MVFAGFKTEYPGREDGTSAEKTIASKDKDFTLLCETFPVSGGFPGKIFSYIKAELYA